MLASLLRLGIGGLLMAAASVAAAVPLGTPPTYLQAETPQVENDQAIQSRIWSPGLDEGFVPQGIGVAGGKVFVSGYHSIDSSVDRGPCRVYRVDARSGRNEGHFDLPAQCGHAGGAVMAGPDTLIVADTRILYKIDVNRAFGDRPQDAVLASLRLSGELKGSFVDFDGRHVLIGTYAKDANKAKAYFLPLELFDTHNGELIDERAASRSFPILVRAQGAAFDRQGALWLTASSSTFGKLQKVDAQTGKPLQEYQMVSGIEDIGFDQEGRLWAVSEAGSRRWLHWAQRFPLIFSLDIDKLR